MGMHEHDGYAPHSHEVRADHRGVERVMDRKANNDRLQAIVQEHRGPDGTVPAMNVASMVAKLTALLDEVAEGTYMAGSEGRC
jgi:hypothetical protein